MKIVHVVIIFLGVLSIPSVGDSRNPFSFDTFFQKPTASATERIVKSVRQKRDIPSISKPAPPPEDPKPVPNGWFLGESGKTYVIVGKGLYQEGDTVMGWKISELTTTNVSFAKGEKHFSVSTKGPREGEIR